MKHTFLAESDSSSIMPMSLPCAEASRLPCTMFPTMTEAGPISATQFVAREPQPQLHWCYTRHTTLI